MRKQPEIEKAYYESINSAAERFIGFDSLRDDTLISLLTVAGAFRMTLGSDESQAVVQTMASFVEAVGNRIKPQKKYIGEKV